MPSSKHWKIWLGLPLLAACLALLAQWSWSAASDARTEARLKARDDAQQANVSAQANEAPREIGGRGGKDPARFGDWEIKGRSIDF